MLNRAKIYLLLIAALKLSPYCATVSKQNLRNPTDGLKFSRQFNANTTSEKQILLDQAALNKSHRADEYDDADEDKVNTDFTDVLLPLRDILNEVCPDSNICEDNNVVNASETWASSMYTSCCLACSCSSNCKSSWDCCFPNTDDVTEYNKVINAPTKGTDALKSCYPTIYPWGDHAPYEGHRSYEMIDSIHNNGSTSDECGNTKVAPWGSIFPVYSKSKREIYKNSVCAVVHGVRDVISFKAIVQCFSASRLFKDNLFTDNIWNEVNHSCYVWFEFPGNSAVELRRHLCFQDIVNTCSNEFHSSYFVHREKIISACNSNFMSPYFGGENAVYKNVFCSICNDDYKRQRCVEMTSIDGRDLFGFIAVLSYDNFESFGERFSEKKVQQACLLRNGKKVADTCRPVMCPKGMMVTTDDDCKHISTTFYDYRVYVYMHLSSDVPIDINGFKESNLLSPWKKLRWTVAYLYYFPSNASGPLVTNDVMIFLYQVFHSVNPEYVHDMVRHLKHSKWTVRTNEGEVSLTGEFAKEEDRDDYVKIFNKTRLMEYIYEHGRLAEIHNSILINELSFCDQVRMYSGEFDIVDTFTNFRGYTYQILYNNFTKQLLFPGQFNVPINDNKYINVCIEKSGLMLVGNSVRSTDGASYVLITILTSICFVNLL